MTHHFKLVNIQPVLIFFGLFGMGITLPVLELYGQNPEVFIANRSSASQVAVFALIVALLPTTVMGIAWWTSRALSHRAGAIMEVMGISIAGFFVSSSLLRYVMASTNLSLAIAILAAVLLGRYGRRQGVVRDWLTFLVVIPLFSLASFFWLSESAGLLWQEDARAEENANIANPIPVILLVLDELPLSSLLREDGQINDSLFPNFARVAESSYWFRNFATNSIATADSIPIILSGVLNEGAKPTSSDHPDTLFTLLGDTYNMGVIESDTSLCPDKICKTDEDGNKDTRELTRTDGSLQLLLDDALIVYGHLAMPPLVRNRLPSIDGRWRGFLGQLEVSQENENLVPGVELPPAPKRGRPVWVNKFLAARDQLATSKTPSLHYTHLLAPHIPWRVNPSGTVYRPPEQNYTLVNGVKGGYWVKSPALPAQGLQRHLSQLGALDMLLGYYIDELQRTGLWHEALVIVTADHGANFKPGSHRRWVMSNEVDALYRVPFFMHLPGQDFGDIKDEPAFSIDILPTIFDVLEISVDWPMTGQSLFGELPPERSHIFDHYINGRRIALDMRLEKLWREIAHNYTLITDTSNWEAIAAVGPYQEMVGKYMAAFITKTNDKIIASFDGFEDNVVVDPHSGIVPTLLTGRVSIPQGYVTSDLLVAVNGIIRGAGYAVNDNGNTYSFSVFVPESAFTRGRNLVELIIASENGQWAHSLSGYPRSDTESLRFGQPVLSPTFPYPDGGFKLPPFSPGNKVPPGDWQDATSEVDGLVKLDLQPSSKGLAFAARYVYVPITAEEAWDVEVLIGSDDTLEVWFEGKKILEHLSPRPARLGDNKVLLRLKPGVNHLYFRVDNRGGAWRLIAKMKPFRRHGDLPLSTDHPIIPAIKG